MLLPLLRASVAIASLCLIAATGPLWFGDSGFPLIPLVGGLTSVPLWIDNLLATLLVASLLLLAGVSIRDAVRLRRPTPDRARPLAPQDGQTTGSTSVRLACVLIVVSGASLALLNQHRLQPWLYHLLLLCPILALDAERGARLPTGKSSALNSQTPSGRGWSEEQAGGRSEARAKPRLLPIQLCRGFLRRLSSTPATQLVLLLTASIYFWSGISKCDRSFAEGHGQTFVAAIADVFGLSLKFWSPQMKTAAAATLPVGELFVATCLLIPRTRRFGLSVSLLMHGLLITAVGPWGMDQRPGVLLWNLLFIAQNILLLRFLSTSQTSLHPPQSCATGSASALVESRTGEASGTQAESARQAATSCRPLQFARGVVLVAAIAPGLRFAGWFDNWPSWAVYTAGNEHAYVLIVEHSVEHLPPDIRRFVQPRALNDGWSWLRIDLWSIAAVDAPLYPQQRFSVACGLAIAERPGMQDAVRLLTESAADPLTGQRTTQSYAGEAALQELAAHFRLNLQSRSTAE